MSTTEHTHRPKADTIKALQRAIDEVRVTVSTDEELRHLDELQNWLESKSEVSA